MVLDHVPDHARLFVVAAAPLDADRLGVGDLDVVDVLAVPHRLEDAVGEAEDEEVLDGLLAEVVVDAEDLRLFEVPENLLVQLARALKTRPEGLLDDDAHPALVLLRQPGLAQLLDGLGVELRRDREVEEAVAPGAVLRVNSFEPLAEFGVALRVLDVRGEELEPGGERAPDLLVHGLRLGELDDRGLHLLAELFVGHRRAPEADDGELGREQALLHEPVERRDEFAPREVARRAEDDDRARLRRTLQTHPHPQWVLRDCRFAHSSQ